MTNDTKKDDSGDILEDMAEAHEEQPGEDTKPEGEKKADQSDQSED